MFGDDEIERMRYELEHPEEMQKHIDEENQAREFIEKTKERFKKEGRDFNKEFQEWKNQNPTK